jgi:N-acetylmuramoyl-L-alanine amidase
MARSNASPVDQAGRVEGRHKHCTRNRVVTLAAIAVVLLAVSFVVTWILSLAWYRTPGRPLPDYPASTLHDKTIVINPGHAGRGTGAVGLTGLAEAKVNLDVARRCSLVLKSFGARVFLQAAGDTDLNEVFNEAKRLQPDLWVSIHHNASLPLVLWPNRSEVYYSALKTTDAAKESKKAAQAIAHHLSRFLGLPVRAFAETKRKHLEAGTGTFTAVLVEASYISNPFQERLLAVPEKRELEARAICGGILDYFTGQSMGAK